MAQRRMFSLKIVDSDAFLDMPQSSQLLYFHLSMRADDDGFVSNPKRIMRMLGSSEDDSKVLFAKRFVIPFESGVCVIKHWRMHNYIQNDRYQETVYLSEKTTLLIKENGSYTEKDKGGIQNVSMLDTQDRLGKDRLGKGSKREPAPPTPAQIARSFFDGGSEYLILLGEVVTRGVPESLAVAEFKKFASYWTEPNKSGSKVRWELERTFDVRRRIATWMSRVGTGPGKGTSRGRGVAV